MPRIVLRIPVGNLLVDHAVEYPEGSSTSLLDALETIRGAAEPGLRYRHSCHHGSCGTCGARADGTEVLMCVTPLASLGAGPVLLEPLRKMDAVGDLAVDPAPLFLALPRGAGYLRSSGVERAESLPGEAAPRRFYDCIECGICESACPVPRGKPFSGPAALALARRDLAEAEARPAAEAQARREADLGFAGRPEGTAACERRFACSRACPQGVAPGRGIEELRRLLQGEER
jgi:succinate dehydrogenase / fumarate reductase iron-sulfur subunit